MNQRLPSGPAVMPSGSLPAVIPVENSVTVPAGAEALATVGTTPNTTTKASPNKRSPTVPILKVFAP